MLTNDEELDKRKILKLKINVLNIIILSQSNIR